MCVGLGDGLLLFVSAFCSRGVCIFDCKRRREGGRREGKENIGGGITFFSSKCFLYLHFFRAIYLYFLSTRTSSFVAWLVPCVLAFVLKVEPLVVNNVVYQSSIVE